MLDQAELDKYFTQEQKEDIIKLNESCIVSAPGRSRRPRVRKAKPGHIPRPVNSFMTFRAEKQSLIRKFCPYANHRDISKIVATWWHHLSNNEKGLYVMKAAEAKIEHSKRYPNYVFKPKSKKRKNQAPVQKKLEIKQSPNTESLPAVEVKSEVIESAAECYYFHPSLNGGQVDYMNDPVVPSSSSMYGDYGCHDAGGCQEVYTTFDLAKFNDAQAMFPEAEGGYYFSSFTPTTQVMETPLLEYSESPSLPEESFRTYTDSYNYPGIAALNNHNFVPALEDNNTLLQYPYDNLTLSYPEF